MDMTFTIIYFIYIVIISSKSYLTYLMESLIRQINRLIEGNKMPSIRKCPVVLRWSSIVHIYYIYLNKFS